MELGEFVNKSIKQLIDGVIDAQKYAEEKGAAINPINIYYDGSHFIIDTQYNQKPVPQMIEFDIVVSVSEGGEIKAGLGVFGGAIGLGTQAKNEDSNTVANRIKFTMPVMFPQQTMPHKK